MAKKGVLLTDKDENFLYPQTILEMVTNKDQSATLDVLLQVLRENLESSIENTNLNVSNLRDELNALLSDETLSGEVRDAILEINSLLNSGSSDITSEVVTSIRQLKEDAVLHSEQSLTSSQKQQARKNVDAVGVVTTYGDGGSWATLSYNDNTIYPETKGKQVKMSNGSNVEDAINTNTSNISANTENIKEKIGLVGSPTVENGVQSGTLGYKNQPLFPTTRDNKVFVQSKSRTLDVVINDIETDISKEETRAQQVEMYLESQKADKTGYYENLSVGVSDNLSGRGEATDSEFSMRPSGGENKSIQDGTARINSIKGNSVVYNQLVKPHHIKTTLSPATSFNLNVIKFEYGHKYLFLKTQSFHKDVYFQSDSSFGLCRLRGDVNSNIVEMTSTTEIKSPAFIYNLSAEDIEIDTYIKVVDLTKMFGAGNEPTTVEEFESLYGNMPDEYNAGTIIDNHTSAIKSVGVNMLDINSEILTPPEYSTPEMPKSWAEVGKIYKGVSFKGYCKSTDLGDFIVKENEIYLSNYSSDYFSGFFLKVLPNTLYDTSIGNYNGCRCIASFYDKNKKYISHYFTEVYGNPYGGRFETPSNCEYVFLVFGIVGGGTATIPYPVCHLLHDGYMTGKYTPYPYYEDFVRELPTVEGGLKSAGTAYDEIRYNKGKDKWEHVQRIGQVDLGTLEWKRSHTPLSGDYFITFLNGIVRRDETHNSINSNGYINYSTQAGFSDKVIAVNIGYFSVDSICIVDSEYTDVATFKQAMQGVILYYELAEPVVTELDVDISPDYKVWDYGTEEAISEVLSTPVRVNTNYGFNAVGQITYNTELIKELLARVAVLEAQVAQQTSEVALMQDVDE